MVPRDGDLHHFDEECYRFAVVRTQIQLTEEQADALKRLAAERGVSMATLVRAAVDRLIADDERRDKWERAVRAVRESRFRDVEGARDVAREHDKYLDDAYFDWRSS